MIHRSNQTTKGPEYRVFLSSERVRMGTKGARGQSNALDTLVIPFDSSNHGDVSVDSSRWTRKDRRVEYHPSNHYLLVMVLRNLELVKNLSRKILFKVIRTNLTRFVPVPKRSAVQLEDVGSWGIRLLFQTNDHLL